jgi:hypothetical protein
MVTPNFRIVLHRRTILIAGAAALLAACEGPFAEVTYSYRFKVLASVNGEERSGESVIKVRYRYLKGSRTNLGTSYQAKAWGEAPVVDLGPDHGLLFALVGGDFPEDGKTSFGVASTSVAAFRGEQTLQEYRTSIAASGARWQHIQSLPSRTDVVELSLEDFPLLLRFGDLSDPRSVQKVDPENMEGSFGPGVRLQSITMQITDEPVTERIRSILPWLDEIDGTLGGPAPVDHRKRTLPQSLTYSHFRQWSPAAW